MPDKQLDEELKEILMEHRHPHGHLQNDDDAVKEIKQVLKSHLEPLLEEARVNPHLAKVNPQEAQNRLKQEIRKELEL
jgi:hypothetical protein